MRLRTLSFLVAILLALPVAAEIFPDPVQRTRAYLPVLLRPIRKAIPVRTTIAMLSQRPTPFAACTQPRRLRDARVLVQDHGMFIVIDADIWAGPAASAGQDGAESELYLFTRRRYRATLPESPHVRLHIFSNSYTTIVTAHPICDDAPPVHLFPLDTFVPPPPTADNTFISPLPRWFESPPAFTPITPASFYDITPPASDHVDLFDLTRLCPGPEPNPYSD